MEAHVDKLDALGFGVGALVRAAPTPDAVAWKLAASFDRIERLDVPMLFVTGWYDHGTARQLDSFQSLLERGGPKAKTGARLLVGPWNHMGVDQAAQGDLSFPSAAGEAARETRLFFDHHLRGLAENGWAERARVRTWRLGEDGWTSGDAWPRRTADADWTLSSDGVIEPLSERPVTGPQASRGWIADPSAPVPTIGGANLPAPGLTFGPRDQAALLARGDVLVWTTAPLAEPLRVEGEARVRVSLLADCSSVDVAVRLCEVLEDGRTILVADAIRRVSVGKREIPLVVVTLPPLAVTFKKGGRLRLLVSGSNWPRFERNPHTGEPHFDPAKARVASVQLLPGDLRLPRLPAAKPAAPGGK
jgi:putative CocE/NonD family hydrolase